MPVNMLFLFGIFVVDAVGVSIYISLEKSLARCCDSLRRF